MLLLASHFFGVLFLPGAFLGCLFCLCRSFSFPFAPWNSHFEFIFDLVLAFGFDLDCFNFLVLFFGDLFFGCLFFGCLFFGRLFFGCLFFGCLFLAYLFFGCLFFGCLFFGRLFFGCLFF